MTNINRSCDWKIHQKPDGSTPKSNPRNRSIYRNIVEAPQEDRPSLRSYLEPSPRAADRISLPLIQAFWAATAACVAQAAILGHAAGFSAQVMATLMLLPIGIAYLVVRFLPLKLFAEVALMVAVAGFGGLGMQMSELLPTAASWMSTTLETAAQGDDPLNTTPASDLRTDVHHGSSHHGSSHHGSSHHGIAHHAGSHGLWHLMPMMIACLLGCRWLCRVRPAAALPRDWRHHVMGLILMLAGMYLAVPWLTPWLSGWIPAVVDMDHVAMVVGMVIGTAVGFVVVDLSDAASRQGIGRRHLSLNPRPREAELSHSCLHREAKP